MTNSQQIKFLLKAGTITEDEARRYTNLEVLSSAAGWYIGTLYRSKEGYLEPGSRDSGYFSSKEIAERALASGDWAQRLGTET